MNINNLKNIYFVGIGGIGMSALARFFKQRQATVSGFDKSETDLTKQLVKEDMSISYIDEVQYVDKNAELVVYTPAIPADNEILNWYRDNNYPVYKRSDVLQWITENMFAITIAGTHGKTTITSMVSHILRHTGFGCNAFLGGISVNYNTNYWHSDNDVAVIEADEYDRSFLKLKPNIAVLTAIDADHLDIYGTEQAVQDAYVEYTHNIKPEGTLIYKSSLKRAHDFKGDIKKTYSLQSTGAGTYAVNIMMKNGSYFFDIVGEGWQITDLNLNIGGMHNVENCVAAIAVVKELKIDNELIKAAVKDYKGVKRRFEYVVKNEKVIYIDDYAHHPEELTALIKSAKTLFSKRRCVIAFQPHLFSRTQDFAKAFAHALDMADEVILLDIYPAREQPIEGVTTALIKSYMGNPNVTILSKQGLLDYTAAAPLDLFITAGAGDIDKLVPQIKENLENRA